MLRQIFIENLDFSFINEAGNVLFAGMQPDAIRTLSNSFYTEVYTKLNSTVPATAQAVEAKVNSFNMGSFFVTNFNGQPAAPVSLPPAAGTLSKKDQIQQAVLTAGIAAACPYAAIAGQFIGSWLQRGQLLDRLNDLNKEQKDITTQKLYTYDVLHELLLNRSLAVLDKKISEERQSYSRFLFDTYKSQAAATTRNIGIYSLRVSNRKALLFFLNEQLREEYALINKGLLQRHGFSLNERITTDPNNYRFAIDQDISLFQWLDNSVASTRADISQLSVYWRKSPPS